ncbi:YbaK/EbsC family protein [Halovivax gelatinilyticus]|uniref:YbaK/EbsC family protein n=1 Tax=Halovivax gelatinilyticus TaxID=2961597 RepID=UPI0020CA2EBE|nr:YbaK/EbsC family protein [Halovivax gelatinilyticus]
MHERAKEFTECAAARYDIEPDVVEFEEGTKTAADAASAIGCETAQIASSLVFTVDNELVVSVTSGANRVDETVLAESFGADSAAVEMADPDRIRETLGWVIGGVPPICHETSVPMVMDRTLLSFDEVWAAAGTPTSVFPIDPETLHALTGSSLVTFDR